jgi:YegS/Rv2252/BmrU family lipid kinase
MKHIYLINPAAGRVDSSSALTQKIKEAYRESGIPVDIYCTKGVGDATRFVREYCENHAGEPLRFYACGGDGTFNEVASGAVGYDFAAVGLLPVGTGNDFMRSFFGADRFMNVTAQRDGEVIDLDMIRCNHWYGVNLLNTGFDCEVVVKTSEIKRSRLVPNGMAYGMGVANTLIRKPGVKVEISLDGGKPRKKELLLCAVGNGARYGGGFTPVPFASLNDGLLDICLVKDVSRAKFIKLVGTYKKGTHVIPENADILEYTRARRVHMKFAKPQNVCMDGEVRQMSECRIDVLPRGLRFVLPAGSEIWKRPDFAGMDEQAPVAVEA